MYGWSAYNARDGFTAAQASLNTIETVGYLWYLIVVWKRGARDGAGIGVRGQLGERVEGGWGAAAALGGFAVSVMTLSKTVLYGEFWSKKSLVRFVVGRHLWRARTRRRMTGNKFEVNWDWLTLTAMNEFHSGYKNIGHNDAASVFFLWIIPK